MTAPSKSAAKAPAANGPVTDVWQLVALALTSCQRVLLHGAPGLGKTWAATRLGLRPGEVPYSCTLTPESPAAELRGFYVPEGDRFTWQDGPAVAAWRDGCRLVLNEIDRASGDVLTFLLAVCDDPEFARLTLPSRETVRPAAGFAVVATMNGDPDLLEPALRDRFPVCLAVTAPAPGALAALPADLRALAAGTAAHAEPARRISPRVWFEFARLRARHGAHAAAQLCFGPRAQDVLNGLALAQGPS